MLAAVKRRYQVCLTVISQTRQHKMNRNHVWQQVDSCEWGQRMGKVVVVGGGGGGGGLPCGAGIRAGGGA